MIDCIIILRGIDMVTHKIIFKGRIVQNLTRDNAIASLASLCKISIEAATPFFDGEPHILKADLSADHAKKYYHFLQLQGLIAEIEPPLEVHVEPSLSIVVPPHAPQIAPPKRTLELQAQMPEITLQQAAQVSPSLSVVRNHSSAPLGEARTLKQYKEKQKKIGISTSQSALGLIIVAVAGLMYFGYRGFIVYSTAPDCNHDAVVSLYDKFLHEDMPTQVETLLGNTSTVTYQSRSDIIEVQSQEEKKRRCATQAIVVVEPNDVRQSVNTLKCALQFTTSRDFKRFYVNELEIKSTDCKEVQL